MTTSDIIATARVGAPKPFSNHRPIAARQRSDLQKCDAAAVVGKTFQEMLERCEALSETLAVIEPINADDELASQQARDHSLHFVL